MSVCNLKYSSQNKLMYSIYPKHVRIVVILFRYKIRLKGYIN